MHKCNLNDVYLHKKDECFRFDSDLPKLAKRLSEIIKLPDNP